MKVAIAAVYVIFAGTSLAFGCDEGKPCQLPNGEGGLCLGFVCQSQISEETRENLSFAITVRYPEQRIIGISNSTLYIRGNGLGLHWDKGTGLRKIMKDTWQTVITYKWSLQGFECQSCNQQGAVYLADNKLQFRIMINDENDMRGPNFVVLFPLSKTSSYFDTYPEFVVYPWFYTDAGTLGTFNVDSSILGKTKELVLYTPPSFSGTNLKYIRQYWFLI